MRTTTLAIVLAAFFLGNAPLASPASQLKSMITLEQLKGMFTNMRAKTKWNLDGEMLWGYYFTDADPKKLEPVASQLAAGGYRIVAIYPARDNSTYLLHVERAEHHTPETLNARNQEFYALAAKFGLRSYDGMDVGPVALKP